MKTRSISLDEAARNTGVPMERLRRAILLGDLVAEPVPDNREYLIDGGDLASFLKGSADASPALPTSSGRKWMIGIGSLLLLGLLASTEIWVLTRGTTPFSTLPPINDMGRGRYKVAPYMREAARLQAMGREAACKELQKAASHSPTWQQDEQITLICRMLFTKRPDADFRRPMRGAASFFGGTDYSDWPLEPMELVDGVPFKIVHGYLLAGVAEPASWYLSYCMESCDWNPAAFHEPSAEEVRRALAKLLSSPKWKRPLDRNELAFLSAQIE